jgi:hypothetical protein
MSDGNVRLPTLEDAAIMGKYQPRIPHRLQESQ